MAIAVHAPAVTEATTKRSLLRRLASYLTRFLAPLPPAPALNYRGRFTVYLTVISVVSVVVAGLAVWHEPPGWLALAFLLACAAGAYYIVEVVPGGSLWSPDDFLMLASIFILGPTGVIAVASGSAIGYGLRRRPGPVLVTYTVANAVVNGTVVWAVYRGALAIHLPGGGFAAAVLVGAVYDTINLAHVMAAISLGKRQFVGWNWFAELKFTMPFAIGYAWAAVGASQLYDAIGAPGISMVAIPVILFQGFLVYLARQVHLHHEEIEANHQERVQLLQDLVVKQQGFVADASHELRTPLTTMSGGLEIMQLFPDMDPEQRQGLVEDALFESRRLSNMVDALLELTRLDSGDQVKRVPFDWTEFLAGSAAELRQRCAPRALAIEIDSDLGTGFGHGRWLLRLLTILVDNVAAHTPPDTEVEFAVTREPNGTIVMTLTDHGPGVADDMLEPIFERFVQIDPSRGGSAPGLGLSLARSIATEHEGTISAEAVDPHGLRVIVRIAPHVDAEE